MNNNFFSGLGRLSRITHAKTRSISAENPTGEKGKGGMATTGFGAEAAREMGRGWKVSPAITMAPNTIYTLADVEGPGMITHIWIAGAAGRDAILRIYWDDQNVPSVESPLADFFAMHWSNSNPEIKQPKGPFFPLNSLPVLVAPYRGYNCFWEMPFKKHCKITIENQNPKHSESLYYQIDYSLCEWSEDCGYFHAQFRRVNPLPPMQDYIILDGVRGQGQYVGTSMGWGILTNNLWWGEGEVKFFIDGDDPYPTICGTGTEDYFLGSYDWEVDGQYTTYTSAFAGMHELHLPDHLYHMQQRFGMYRWHIMDPIRFEQDLRVTIQSIGWQSDFRYKHGQHDICSTAFWYQSLPTAPFPALPSRNELEVL